MSGAIFLFRHSSVEVMPTEEDLSELGGVADADLADSDPIRFDPADALVRSRRCPWASLVPWYSLGCAAFFVTVFYSGLDSAPFEIDTAKPRELWRTVTYAWFHYSPAHLWINVATWLVYCGLVETENGWARAAVLSQTAIVGGGLACFWQTRFIGTEMVVAGASGGIYGMLAVQIGFLLLYWRTLHTVKKVSHVALLVGATVCEAVVTAVLFDPQTAYAAHLGGFLTNAFAGPFVLRLGRSGTGMGWGVPGAAGLAAAAILIAGTVNALVPFTS